MKNSTKVLLIVWLSLAQAAVASEQREQVAEYNGYDREELKAALAVLIDAGALALSDPRCPQVDMKLLQELRKDGIIKNSRPATSSICVDIID